MCEKGDTGPLEPIEDPEISRWCEKRPADRGVTWPFGNHDSVCIASGCAKKGAEDSWAARLLCREGGNKEGSARVGVGMLSKADKGEEPMLEYWDRIDCVDTGDDDRLW